jgi:hypothetical protein
MSKNQYRDLIFTNHVLSRMKQRGIDSEQIWETYKSPDEQSSASNGATERKKRFGNYLLSIIFKHNEKNEIVIISAWMDPPMPDSKDAREKEWWEKYKRAGFWGKLWLTLIKQISP